MWVGFGWCVVVVGCWVGGGIGVGVVGDGCCYLDFVELSCCFCVIVLVLLFNELFYVCWIVVFCWIVIVVCI